MAVAVELALLWRVSYGGLEAPGSRLQGLLVLLAEDPVAADNPVIAVDVLFSC
jgi:hypothetical protein